MAANELLELRAYVLALVHALFDDDRLDGIQERLPTQPAQVTSTAPEPHQWDESRVKGFHLTGSFSTTDVMTLGVRGGEYMDRYDVVTSYVVPNDRPEHLGARLSTQGQPGWTVDSLTVEAETLQNPPEPPPELRSSRTRAPAPAVDPTPPPAPSGPLIGGLEPVPAFELATLQGPARLDAIERMRTLDARVFHTATSLRRSDPGTMDFGMPPSFMPVVDLMVDGMVFGLMIDMPEVGFVPMAGCLIGYTMDGATIMDARNDPVEVVRRAACGQRLHLESTGDAKRLDAWNDAAEQLCSVMGWDPLPAIEEPGYGWKDKRYKPDRSPPGTKWRTDAGGNGVLATVEQWGDEPVRKPRSIDEALRRAPDAAPAMALHLLREALVLANRANDAGAVTQVYAAMVDAHQRLGRPTVAARAAALAAL